MVQQVTFLGSDARIRERLVYLHRFCLYVLPIFPIESLLSDFANVDFGIEVCCECLVMVAGIAVHDIQVLNFVEVMFGCICSEYACHSGVKSAAQYGCQSSLLEAFAISPLPTIFKVCLMAVGLQG